MKSFQIIDSVVEDPQNFVPFEKCSGSNQLHVRLQIWYIFKADADRIWNVPEQYRNTQYRNIYIHLRLPIR